MKIEIIGVPNIPEIRQGDDLSRLILAGCEAGGIQLAADDVLVVTQKIVSKAEGRMVDLNDVTPSQFAQDYAEKWGKDPRQIEVVLQESTRIVRMDKGVVICETRHGFVCANAGVDASNVPGGHLVTLLPVDSDASALAIREVDACRDRG